MCVREPFPGRIRACLALLAPVVATVAAWGQTPQPPKVPFSNHPCQSLTPADEATLKMPSPTDARPDRAPVKLAFDNMCTYTHAGTQYAQVGYMTKADYDTNSTGNRSASRQAPTALPGAFYDKQGGLWIAKNGYYFVVSGRQAMREPVARLIAGKL
ncbi:MAG TPA: hypothetical protein VKE94_22875 [Gemmataceae bacterium]|nr:hypothetical protein [Gemmataceae bacterium]